MNITKDRGEWKVLLIGGSSGVGKTLVAQELTCRLSASLLLVDDVRLALQQVTTPAQQPELHVFLNYQAQQWRKPESIRDDWIVVGKAMIPSLKVIMAHHIVVPSVGRVIIEGDGILPSLSVQSNFSDLKQFSGLRVDYEVRSVFIIEQDEEKILSNLQARGRGFEDWGQEEQRGFAHASWLFGQWLVRKAREYGQPVLPAQPYKTLPERILTVIS